MMIGIPLIRPVTWRLTVVVGSSLSMLAAELAATKLASKLASVWMLVMSSLIYIPFHHQVSKANIPAAVVTSKAAELQRPTGRVRLTTPKVAVSRIAKQDDNLSNLHSFEKEYTCLFTGKVICGDSPCQTADIQIHVTSKQNPEIVKTVSLQSDGSYEASVLIKEILHENVDWWIVADSQESGAKQIQGRQILMDDALINIEETIQLL